MRKLLVLLALMGPAWCLWAQEADGVAAEKSRITVERDRADAVFKEQEKTCYGKFAVNDCIDAARAKRREVMADLRRREIALDDAERKRKAAERAREVEERNSAEAQRDQAGRQAKALAEQQQRESRAAAKAAERASRERQQPAPAAKEGKQDAARQQKDAEAERNRKEHEQRMAEAEERRIKQAKRLAERNKPPAQPLPVPP